MYCRGSGLGTGSGTGSLSSTGSGTGFVTGSRACSRTGLDIVAGTAADSDVAPDSDVVAGMGAGAAAVDTVMDKGSGLPTYPNVRLGHGFRITHVS